MNKTIITIMTIFLSFTMMAQEKLSLSKAINYALINKAEAKKATLEVENANYLIQEARANALPQINAVGDVTYNSILQKTALNFNGENSIIEMGRPWQSTATIALNQQVFNLAVFTGLKAARTTRDFYRINKELTEEQIIEKVANSYYDIYKTESQIKTVQATIDNTSRVQSVISNLYKNGLAKKIDLDRINVTLNNLQSSKQQLNNGLELKQNALKFLIGMDIKQPVTIENTEFEVNTNLLGDLEIDLEDRTEIKLLEKQQDLLKLNKKATEAMGYPTLSLIANYGYSGIGSEFPWFQNYPGAYWSNFSAVGLKINVPIFNGFSVRSKTRQAQNQIDQFEVDFENTRLALNLEIQNAITQITNSIIMLKTQNANVGLAKDVLNNIENNYKNGLASLTDLLDAETSYADAQNNYTTAIIDYKLAEVQLIKAKGELKTLTK